MSLARQLRAVDRPQFVGQTLLLAQVGEEARGLHAAEQGIGDQQRRVIGGGRRGNPVADHHRRFGQVRLVDPHRGRVRRRGGRRIRRHVAPPPGAPRRKIVHVLGECRNRLLRVHIADHDHHEVARDVVAVIEGDQVRAGQALDTLQRPRRRQRVAAVRVQGPAQPAVGRLKQVRVAAVNVGKKLLPRVRQRVRVRAAEVRVFQHVGQQKCGLFELVAHGQRVDLGPLRLPGRGDVAAERADVLLHLFRRRVRRGKQQGACDEAAQARRRRSLLRHARPHEHVHGDQRRVLPPADDPHSARQRRLDDGRGVRHGGRRLSTCRSPAAMTKSGPRSAAKTSVEARITPDYLAAQSPIMGDRRHSCVRAWHAKPLLLVPPLLGLGGLSIRLTGGMP